MKNMYTSRKLAFVFCCLFSLFSFNAFAQVGINTTAPGDGSLLDVSSTDKGVFVPRVSIASLSTIAPITGITNTPAARLAAAGLLVYNTNVSTGVGFYYWNGTQWVNFTNGNDEWKLTGNTGTVAGTNFLGTTDNIAMQFKTRNFSRFEITSGNTQVDGGRLRAFTNGTSTQPIYSWQSNPNTGMFQQDANVIGFSTNGKERLRIPNENQIHAVYDGTNALPFYSWSGDSDTGMYRILDNTLGFSTSGTERVRVAPNGNVRIGSGSNATEKLEVAGNLRLIGAFMPNNLPGGTDKILLSQGTNTAPVWGPGFLNTTQITNIGKYYVPLFNINNDQFLTITIADPNMTRDTAIICNFVGPLPVAAGINYGNNITLLAEPQVGQVVFHVANVDSGYNLNNMQIVYTAFYH